jgi:hypothetical protein
LALAVQVAHLFDVTNFSERESGVRFFSVDLGFNILDRSYIQHVVHSLIARKASCCSVAIFRHHNAISMSVAYDKANANQTVYLSDWFELNDTAFDAFFAGIGESDFSLRNGTDFTSDLIYLTARDYYIRPLSFEYLRYELNSDENYLNEVIKKYGADYVADAYIEVLNTRIDIPDEIDFDLIEYELEQMEFPESEEFDDDDDFNDFDDDTGNNITGGIPKEVLADPVLLLKWLDDCSAEKVGKTERDRKIISLINAVDIDYIDHRDNGGCLWIFGGYELSEFVEQCKELGFVFHFKEGGGSATDGFDSWWFKN